MNTDQKFNAISERTEYYLNTESPLPKTRVIAEYIARKAGMPYKDFNTVFNYLTGIPFMASPTPIPIPTAVIRRNP